MERKPDWLPGFPVQIYCNRNGHNHKNNELLDVYEAVYEKRSKEFFSESNGEEQEILISMFLNWKDKRVLEVGCGEVDLSVAVSGLGAKSVLACDYSQSAIDVAKGKIGERDNVKFFCDNWNNVAGNYDVILMAGVLEHFDNPFDDLKYMMCNLVDQGGCIITSSPSFLNPRGYVWMTLALLLDVPMSLTGLHFFAPWQFEDFSNANGYA